MANMRFSWLIIAPIFLHFFTQKISAESVITAQVGGSSTHRSREPKYKIEFHSEDLPYIPGDDQESVFMPNDDGKNYLCFLPKVEKPKSGKPVSQYNTTGMIMESEKRMKVKTPDELLEVLDEHCLLRQDGWWTYEFCFKKTLRQLHLEDEKIAQEFVLGVYDPEATDAYHQNQSDISILKDPHSKDASQRYHAHQYTNGTVCDLTNQHRETEVRFVCSEGKTTITSITELSTCKYALTVQTPMLCAHPLFHEERPVWHAIHCNLLTKDANEVKVEDIKHGNKINLVSDIEYPFNIGVEESAV
ncbi:protein OS-9 homolog [Beta vulgaris subsp. vulgaris]|uniref:protein OS-9 homolog n=1 Tax=Beta vulgaris subsp. vulgaris TaxID=3555 RepID=UPI002036FA70|nr:protein OS-9 homolog [Beta vulgaris subsp. vulgaris]